MFNITVVISPSYIDLVLYVWWKHRLITVSLFLFETFVNKNKYKNVLTFLSPLLQTKKPLLCLWCLTFFESTFKISIYIEMEAYILFTNLYLYILIFCNFCVCRLKCYYLSYIIYIPTPDIWNRNVVFEFFKAIFFFLLYYKPENRLYNG